MDLFLLMEYFNLSIKIYIYIYIFPVLSPIAILNSPTQFLSLTLSFPLAISLRLCCVCVCVYGCLAVGLGTAILVGM